MTYIFKMFFVIVLLGCSAPAEKPKSQYYLDNCEKVKWKIRRCENKEVVCYLYFSGRILSCFKK